MNKYDSSRGTNRLVGVFSNDNRNDFSTAHGYVPGVSTCAYNVSVFGLTSPPWCNNWMGINCDLLSRVSKLNIQGVSWSQQTHIHAAIGNLGRLQSLQMNGMGLMGQIPSTIGRLSALTWLSLSNNMLTGPVPALPASLVKVVNNGWVQLDTNCNLTSTVPSIMQQSLYNQGQCRPLAPGTHASSLL